MRVRFLVALVIVTLLGAISWYQQTSLQCPVPFTYRIGEVAPEFALSESEVRAYLMEAETIWEEATGRELFMEESTASFPVNFIFDDRQADANSEASQRARLDAKRSENDAVLATLAQLQAEYEVLRTQYQAQVSEYEARLSTYNETVNRYNDRGGAPANVFGELETERARLSAESAELNRTQIELNSLASELNEFGQRAERLVNEYNRDVERYNAQFGFEREFTQGDFTRDRINIYKFSTGDELVSVLAHEFGHALGIGHVEDDSSLMYYLLDETNFKPRLSAYDLEAFLEVCGEDETYTQRIRHLIRVALSPFTQS